MSTRRGPGGVVERFYRGRWVPESTLTPEQIRESQAQPEVQEPTEPVRRKVTARQLEVWTAVQEHGSQVAAAKALGTSQGTIQTALKGYMAVMGLKGPLPGRLPPREELAQPELDVTQTIPTTNGHAASQAAAEPIPSAEPSVPAPEARPPMLAEPAHDVSTVRQAPDDDPLDEVRRYGRQQMALQAIVALVDCDSLPGNRLLAIRRIAREALL